MRRTIINAVKKVPQKQLND